MHGDRAYKRNHKRVRDKRGPAKLQICAHCGNPAEDWATLHDCSGESPDDYMPLCKKCHAKYDIATWAKNPNPWRKTHCLNGHNMDDAWVSKTGARKCRICHRERQSRYRAAQRAAKA